MKTPKASAQITRWFSFGQVHVHSVDGVTFDKDCLVEITSEDPRKTMMETFGPKWAMEYSKEMMEKSLHFYKRGVIKL